jgi:hypothetical protein
MSLPDLRLDISLFDNARDVRPVPRVCSVGGLARSLTTFPVIQAANKLDLPAWSPARFAIGATRKASAVEFVSCLVLDHDDGDPEAALAAWAGWVAILHSTWSHRPDAPRFRVVVPLAQAVPAERWGAALAWAAERSVGADPACKDPSRIYFRPAIPFADAPRLERVQVGDVLDVLPLLPAEPPPKRPAKAALLVPARLRDRAVGVRLGFDPESRERVAAEIGATLAGEGLDRRAVRIPCPACGCPSVWFYLTPTRLRWARCNHRKSCGWKGPLEDLILRGAA